MKKILFVCLGNICRSPIAECVAATKATRLGLSNAFQFSSAGTHPPRKNEPADPRACKVALQRQYDLSGHKARRVQSADFARFDLILAMDKDNLAALKRICPPEHLPRLGLFLDALQNPEIDEVPDPYFGNINGFERVFDLCEACLDAHFRDNRLFGRE